MGVMSQKEYASRKTRKAVPVDKSAGAAVPVVQVPKTEFLLFNPEVEENFSDVVILDGHEIKRNCVNGIIKTQSKSLVEFLKSKGFELLETREVTQ